MKRFELTDQQEAKFLEWRKEKYKNGMKDSMAGAAGGIFSFTFTPTSLGLLVKATCLDKTEIDLTEYEYF